MSNIPHRHCAIVLLQDVMPGVHIWRSSDRHHHTVIPKLIARPRIWCNGLLLATNNGRIFDHHHFFTTKSEKSSTISQLMCSWFSFELRPEIKSTYLRVESYAASSAARQLSLDDHVNADIGGYFGTPCWRTGMPMRLVLSFIAPRMQRIDVTHPGSDWWNHHQVGYSRMP